MSVSFKIESLRRSYQNGQLFNDPYLDAVNNIECYFEFKINQDAVLKVDGWNLVEFIEQLLQWQITGYKQSFKYNCIDTKDDIFFLLFKENKYKFYSDWQEFDCPDLINLEEIKNLIAQLQSAAETTVLDKLNVDLRKIDSLSFKTAESERA